MQPLTTHGSKRGSEKGLGEKKTEKWLWWINSFEWMLGVGAWSKDALFGGSAIPG